jgi:hypothetical protein
MNIRKNMPPPLKKGDIEHLEKSIDIIQLMIVGFFIFNEVFDLIELIQKNFNKFLDPII